MTRCMILVVTGVLALGCWRGASAASVTLVPESVEKESGEKEKPKKPRPQGPTTITSERMEFDYRDMVALFEENVKIKDPELTMTSDRLLVYFQGTNDVRQVTASGHVYVESGNRSAKCDKAVYIRAEEQLILTGNVTLKRDLNEVSGRRITFWINDERVLVESDATMTIHPDREKMGARLP